MGPREDMAEKKISPPRSGWAAIHDGKNMASKITISCLGDGSYIGDPKSQIPATAKVPGMSTSEQGVKYRRKFISKSENLGLLLSLHF